MKGTVHLWVCLAFTAGAIAGVIGGMLIKTDTANARTTNTLIIAEPGTIRFIVDGREQAYLDKTGMYVNGDVAYSGAIQDSVDYTSAGQNAEQGAGK